MHGSLCHDIQNTADKQMLRHPKNVFIFHWLTLWPRLVLSNLILMQALDDMTRSGIITWMSEWWHGKQYSWWRYKRDIQSFLLTSRVTSNWFQTSNFNLLNDFILEIGMVNYISVIICSLSARVNIGLCTNSTNL